MGKRGAVCEKHPRIARVLARLVVVAAVSYALPAQSDTQPPAVNGHSPALNASDLAPSIVVTAIFSEPVQPASVSFVLRDSANAQVSAVVSYDASTRTATLDPTQDLSGGGTYTATVSGAADLLGNVQSAPVAWSFTTAVPGFRDTVVFSGLATPTAFQFAADGRVFVAEKSGVIKVFDNLTDTTPTVFADLRTNVHDFGERGLLGMALDPGFPTRPYVYVLYTHDAPIGGTAPLWGGVGGGPDPCPDPSGTGCAVSARLSRLQASGSVMVGVEEVLLEDWFQQFPGQSIGDLAFGPDGALYASAGDGANSTQVDSGQFGNPNNDPPSEGGALRSQDLRTPADRVTLDGSIIRVDADTGQPLRRTTSMTVGAPTTNANGIKSYSVTSVYQGPNPIIVRVLEPTSPAPGKPPRFLYVLPVEAGVTGLGSVYSDGLEELQLLNVHNRYNATLIAPSFHIEPWYGDHDSDPERQLERFILNDLVPFGDSFAPSGQLRQRWLVGFSKSGNGVLSLILRHPHVFSAAAAWDGPAQFTDMSAFPGMAENFGTEQNFDRYEIPTLVIGNAEAFRQQVRTWISGDESAWTAHMVQLHQQMQQVGFLHTWVQSGPRVHSWYSGWLDGAVASLDANAGSTAPVDSNAQRIIAYGLRRPARFAFRPGTSELWLGDNGWDAAEEINRIGHASDGAIENFGWPCYEATGTTTYTSSSLGICNGLVAQPNIHTPPVFAYQHSQAVVNGDSCGIGPSAISGLAFYNSGSYPAAYNGGLFFADRLRRCIWVMFPDANGLPQPQNRATVLAGAASPTDVKVGPGGDLFYTDRDGGTVRKLVYSVGNQRPTAAIQAAPTSGPLPLTVTFNGTASSDPEGATLTYAWDLDADGAFDDATVAAPQWTYAASGTVAARLLVNDGSGLSDVAAVVISVNNSAPTAIIDTPANTLTWKVGDAIAFTGRGTDPEAPSGTLPASALTWSVILHHCPSPCHTHAIQSFTGVAGGSFTAPDHEYPSHLELQLTVTDAGGLQSTAGVLLQPQTAALTFESSPSGLQVSVNATAAAAPFTRTVIVGSANVVSAPSPQALYQFASWSDGGAQTHTVTAAGASTSYTATYSQMLPPGLVAAYGMNEGTGATVADWTGSGLAGTITGATWTAQGKFGNGLTFDGGNDWVTVADANALDLITGMTLEAWVFPTATAGVRDILIKEGTGVDIYNLYARNWRGLPEANVRVGSANRTAEGAALPANVWTHVAGTYDGSAVRLFINGAQVASTAVTGSIATSTGPLRFGGNSMWGEYFAGRLDEVRVYNRALSAAEIQTDMDTPVGGGGADSTPPVRSNGSPSGILPWSTTQTTVSVATNENATCRYSTSAGVTFSSMTDTFTLTGGATHSTTVSGLTSGGSYSVFLRCQDISGNANPDDLTISFSVAPQGQDVVPPNVVITSPLDAATVAGTISVTANATDDIGVVGVQFLLNGANLNAEVLSPPYAASWDTTTAAAGTHVLTARARDAAGRITTSSPVTVNVTNNPVPENFRDEVVIGAGLTFPTAFEFLPDGRMLIAEFRGRLLVAQPGAAVFDPTPVIQLTNVFDEEVTAGGERGLVNVVADPAFSTNGFIYLFYTAAAPQRDRVSRFTMSGNTASSASEFVIWQGAADSNSTDHHGGGVAFGPDGRLYISTGDNGDPPSSQPLTSDHGKVLRFNKDGTVPSDNPFFDGAGPNIDAIWARGLRNPYRFSFDPANGRMYIGDVGLNTIEELNVGIAGGNYGWPTCEGSCGTTGFTNPLFTYSHGGRDAAITGGFVYRGTQFPTIFQGAYFYGDFAQNWIRYLTFDAGGAVTASFNMLPPDGALDGPYDPVMLKPGPDGSLYYVDFGWGWQGDVNPASIRRIRYIAGNLSPVAVVSATPQNGQLPLAVSFSSQGSLDPEGQPLSYIWTFGDGAVSNDPNPVHAYTQTGVFQAQLTLLDGESTTISEMLTISVGNPPLATISVPTNGSVFRAGDLISFSGVATDAEDGPLPSSGYTWTILFHHDTHVHPTFGPTSGQTSGTLNIPSTGHDFSGTTYYEIILTATDSSGLQTSSSVSVFPRKVNLTFVTVPAGLSVKVDGTSRATPYVKDTLTGFQHTMEAPNQAQGGVNYGFVSWSDGGAQAHGTTAGEANTAYTATYQQTTVTAFPNSATVLTGTLSTGTAAALTADDNVYYAVNSTTTGTRMAAWYGSFSGVPKGLTSLRGNYKGKNSGNCTQTVAMWNWATSAWVQLDSRTVGTTEVAINNLVPTGTLADYVSGTSGNGELRVRIQCQATANRISRGDVMSIVYDAPVGPPDTTAPVRANGQPSGVLPSGTTQTTLSLTTDEASTCRYGTTPGVSYSSLPTPFTTTGSTTHSTTVTGLSSSGSYIYYVRCQDVASNANPDDFTISFLVAQDTTPPVLSNGQPSGTLPAGTTQTTLSLTTNEYATCRYGPSAGVVHASLPSVFTTTDGTSHNTVVTGLTNGTSYTYYVRCQDGAANPNPDDFAIAFSVANPPPPDTTPPVVSITAPANGATVSGNVTVTANASDNVGVVGVQFLLNGAALGAEDTTAPYSIVWNSTSVPNGGTHQLSARARDAATNQMTATSVSVTVDNTALGLVATYSFNEGSGTTLTDRTGLSHTGTISGATWTTQGRFGNALTFDGINDWVTISDANDLDFTTGMTLEAWVFPTTSGGGSWRNLLIKERSGGEVYNLYANTNTNIPAAYVVRAAQSGTPLDARGTSQLPLNTWTHLAVTYDNATLRLYVNGVQVGTRAVAGPLLTSTGVLRLGGNGIWGEFLAGQLDEVRIYNRALSAAEVQADMNAPIQP